MYVFILTVLIYEQVNNISRICVVIFVSFPLSHTHASLRSISHTLCYVMFIYVFLELLGMRGCCKKRRKKN